MYVVLLALYIIWTVLSSAGQLHFCENCWHNANECKVQNVKLVLLIQQLH